MNLKNRYIQTFSAMLFSLFFMMLIRLFFLFRYPGDFEPLSTLELLQTLFMGMRIDIITLFTFTGIYVLLLTLPLQILSRPKVRQGIALLWITTILGIALVSFADILYFEFSRRHLSSEPFNLGNDMEQMLKIAFGSFLYYVIGAVVTASILYYLFVRYFRHEIRPLKSPKIAWIGSLLILIVLIAGIRGNVSGSKSLGISDAFVVNKVCSGNLALNGFFCIYRSSGDKSQHLQIPDDEAISMTRTLLADTNAPYVDPQYPLMRAYKKPDGRPYNVIIILLESFGAEHIDGFTHYPELGVTPYLKELSQKGLKFDNFYSNGYRSIFGITSVYTGVSLPSGFDYLGSGLELSNLSYLGHLADKNGYDTLAMQGSNRRSYRVDAVSHLAGFKQFYGAEDIPSIEKREGDRHPATGVYDHDLLQFFHKKLGGLKEPFLGFAFTATTHSDFHLPSSKYERYKHDLKGYKGYLNALIYTDTAIKRFMQSCEKEPWFDNTLFLFTADHGSGDAGNPVSRALRGKFKAKPSIEHFRIPLIIYAPKVFAPRKVTTLGSHVDIFPTLADILGWQGDFTVLGNSLFDEGVHERFVLLNGVQVTGLIRPDSYLLYNYKDIVETNASDPQALLEELKAVDTAQTYLIQENRWYRP